jgi:CDP-6-deoxy-D-xylo-4-hexulose-3-dehydrase
LDYDDKYVFDDLGYNFLPSEISAAFALVQLDNLKANVKNRSENFSYLKNAISVSANMRTFETYEDVYTGWLAFPLMLCDKLKNKRKEVQIYLEKAGIQTRTIFTGNILRQPVAKKFKWDSFGTFEASDSIMGNGILLGCHNQQTKDKLDYMIEKLLEAEACLA